MSNTKVLPNTGWFEAVHRWNRERGLDCLPFNHQKEVSFIIEEVLESAGTHDSDTAREHAERLAKKLVGEASASPEEIVDAFADMIVFATGAMIKLGFDPAAVMQEVFKAIDSRKGELIDGKFIKDKNAPRYEPDYSSCEL